MDKAKIFSVTTFFNIVAEILTNEINQEKEMKSQRLTRKKLLIFVDDMIVYVEKPKESIKKVLERISKLNMITATKSIYK